MPQSMLLPLHCADEQGFTDAVEASILVGGCTSSRASIAGACWGALGGDTAVPEDWLVLAAQGAQAQELAAKLVALRVEG